MRFDFNPFLNHQESFPETKTKRPLPEKKVSLTMSETESKQVETKEIFQPHDRRIVSGAMPLSSSGAIKYAEAPDKETMQPEQNTNEVKKIKLPKNYLHQDQTFYSGSRLEFGANPLLRENAKLHQEAEAKNKARENIRLFKSTDIEKITDFLIDGKEDPEFKKEIENTKVESINILESANYFLTNKDWELLTALRLFDKGTFEHSVGTYLIAKDKIERLKEIKDPIIDEGVSLEQFYRSCLLHDIGKMIIPEFVLNKKTSDLDWINGFLTLDDDTQTDILAKHKLAIPDSIRSNPQQMTDYLIINRKRAVSFVPARLAFTDDEFATLKEKFPNIDDFSTLKDIFAIHEKTSETILGKFDLRMEAFLAGSHHNHQSKDEKIGNKSASITSLNLSKRLATTLHLADMKAALKERRSYHNPHDLLRILALSIDAVRDGDIEADQTYVWIMDEIPFLSTDYLDKVRTMNNEGFDQVELQKQKYDLKTIEDFLNEHM